MRLRVSAEWALRATTLAALGVLLWRWTHPVPAAAPTPEVVSSDSALGAALRRWTAAPVQAAHVALGGLPSAAERAWLRALGSAGMRVTWSAADARPLAVSATPVVDPAGGVRVEVADAPGGTVAVGDAFAAADTLRAAGGRGAVMLPTAADTVIVHTLSTTGGASSLGGRPDGRRDGVPDGATAARVTPPPAPRLGAVLVLGRAGWEAKFVAAALEERGWPVRLRAAVGPALDVAQGSDAPDTATTAAVVVLDSAVVTAADAARIARYVRAGGGLVLAGDAPGASGLRALAAGALGTPIPGVPGAIDGATPTRGLTLSPVEPRRDAVVLERRDGGRSAPAAVAARRIGAGRVAQVGYAETWQWRMAADDGSPAAHRAWWARVIGAVAYAPVPIARADFADPAPLAATIDALGPARAAPAVRRTGLPAGRFPGDAVLAALAAAALLGEVASRRMRGAR